MNKSKYILLTLSSLVALSSCQTEEPNAPVSDIETSLTYEGGRECTFTDEELNFWDASTRYDETVTVARRGLNHRTSVGEASENAGSIEFLNVTWYLSEGYSYSDDGAVDGVEFVPMAPISTDISAFVRTMESYIESGYVSRVIGFDPTDSDSFTAADAISQWAALEYLEVPLASPVANLLDRTWIEEFLSLATAEGIRMDYLAVEFEGSVISAGSGAELLTQLKSALSDFNTMIASDFPEYKDLPVILTGVGAPDEVVSPYTEDGLKELIKEFMTTAQAWLESNDCTDVETYAWHTYNKSALPATLISASNKLQQMGYLFVEPTYNYDWSNDIPEVEYENMLNGGDFDSGESSFTSNWSGNGYSYITYSAESTAQYFFSGGGTGMVSISIAGYNLYQNNVMLKPNYRYAMGLTGRIHSVEGSVSGENAPTSDAHYLTINLRPSSNGGSSYTSSTMELWSNYGKGITSCNDSDLYHAFNTSSWSTDTYIDENNQINTRLIVATVQNGCCAYVDNVYLYELGEYEKPVATPAVDVEDNLLLDGTFEDSAAFSSKSKWTIYNNASYISYDDDTVDLFMDNGGSGMVMLKAVSGTTNLAQNLTIEYGKKYKFGFTGRIQAASGYPSGQSEPSSNGKLTVNFRAGTGPSVFGMEYTDHGEVIESCEDTNLTVELDTTDGKWDSYINADNTINLRVIIVKPTAANDYAYIDNAYLIEITD